MRHFTIEEVVRVCGVRGELITTFIREEWIRPSEEETPLLDDEDVARIRLIHDLREEFGVNDESMPIILHLLDQLYCLQQEVRRVSSSN